MGHLVTLIKIVCFCLFVFFFLLLLLFFCFCFCFFTSFIKFYLKPTKDINICLRCHKHPVILRPRNAMEARENSNGKSERGSASFKNQLLKIINWAWGLIDCFFISTPLSLSRVPQRHDIETVLISHTLFSNVNVFNRFLLY